MEGCLLIAVNLLVYNSLLYSNILKSFSKQNLSTSCLAKRFFIWSNMSLLKFACKYDNCSFLVEKMIFIPDI